MPSHEPCMDDDCPCYLSGRESMRTDYLLATSSVVEAATNLVRTITEADDPVLVTLSHGDEAGPMLQVRVEVHDSEDGLDIDARGTRAKATALDALRPFVNNRTYFDATLYEPVNIDLIPVAARAGLVPEDPAGEVEA